jgi:hypothetical protein
VKWSVTFVYDENLVDININYVPFTIAFFKNPRKKNIDLTSTRCTQELSDWISYEEKRKWKNTKKNIYRLFSTNLISLCKFHVLEVIFSKFIQYILNLRKHFLKRHVFLGNNRRL